MPELKASNNPVADNLRRWINYNGLKQVAVAHKAGFTAQELSDMLNGRRLIRAIDIANIINALGGIDANILFEMEEAMSDAGKNLSGAGVHKGEPPSGYSDTSGQRLESQQRTR